MFKLDKDYVYKLNSMPRGKNVLEPILNSCNIPHRAVVVDFNSNCLICHCDGWLPIPVGQVQDFNSLAELFDSPIARRIQQDVDSKKFTWCAVEHCGVTNKNIEKKHFELSINIDESCNLHCPSCRREPIMHTSGAKIEKKLQDINRIMTWLENFNSHIHIVISGNGDPLASAVIRPLIKNYKPKSNQTFRLFTNGLLLRKQLETAPLLPNITEMFISIDAGSKNVYENVRRGGIWEVLLDNFEFLTEQKLNHLVRLNFAVQKNNYQDLYNFVELGRKYSFRCGIHQLDDWGTWNYDTIKNPDPWTIANGTYLDHAVLKSSHPEHLQCLSILKDILKQRNSFVMYSPMIQKLLQQ